MALNELLPDKFDPSKHERKLKGSLPLKEFVKRDTTLLEATFSRMDAAGTIRCWRCHKQPDGSIDCFQIDCPKSWPPLTLAVSIG